MSFNCILSAWKENKTQIIGIKLIKSNFVQRKQAFQIYFFRKIYLKIRHRTLIKLYRDTKNLHFLILKVQAPFYQAKIEAMQVRVLQRKIKT